MPQPCVLAADASGLEIVLVVGKPLRVGWEGIHSARWDSTLDSGRRIPDPDGDRPAPILTLIHGEAEPIGLAFRTSQAVPPAGALSKRLGDRTPPFPPPTV